MKNYILINILIIISSMLAGVVFAENTTHKPKPNVIFIAIDDLNNWVGCMGGHPQAKTPNIDRLAKRGILFTNGHTTAPVCNPSRAAFLSGIAPWRSGVYHNGDNWNRSQPLVKADYIPAHFQNNGYETMMAGKIFHGRAPKGKNLINENAGYFGGLQFGLRASDFPDPFKDLKGIHNFAFHWGGLDEKDSQQLSDPKIANWAVQRLSRTYDKPFMLMIGFFRPHTPLTSPKTFWDMFEREKIELPPLKEDDLDDMPWPGRQVSIAGYQEMEKGHYKTIVDKGHHHDVVRGYLAACAFVDAQVGKVLDALDKSQHKENTIVVLFSDHGWGIGERYHFKKWGLWGDITRIPYIFYVPGVTKPGSRCDAGVDLLDLFPTLIDLTGLQQPPQKLDGRSLRPLLENPNAVWERPALTTYGQDNYALKTSRWRYIRWSNGSEELYDHANDPHEWHNVADREEHKSIKSELSKWFPEKSVISVDSDHSSPVILNKSNRINHFRTISPSFVNQNIRIKAKIGPNIGDGVILSHGGQFSGYALYIKNGILHFSIMDVPRPLSWDKLVPSRTILKTDSPIQKGKEYDVEALLDKEGNMTITLDGEVLAQRVALPLSIHPAGVMQMGAASTAYISIGNYETPFQFSGDIQEVRVMFGGN